MYMYIIYTYIRKKTLCTVTTLSLATTNEITTRLSC